MRSSAGTTTAPAHPEVLRTTVGTGPADDHMYWTSGKPGTDPSVRAGRTERAERFRNIDSNSLGTTAAGTRSWDRTVSARRRNSAARRPQGTEDHTTGKREPYIHETDEQLAEQFVSGYPKHGSV